MSGFAFGFGYRHDDDDDGEDQYARPTTRGGGGGGGGFTIRPQSSRGGMGNAAGFRGVNSNAHSHNDVGTAANGPRYQQHPPDTASTYDYDGEVSYVTGHLSGQSFTSSPISSGGRPFTRGMTGHGHSRTMSDVNEEDEYGAGYGTYDHHHQNYIDEEEEEEEEEESDAEGVFAYLRPGTAEQQQAQLQAQVAAAQAQSVQAPGPSTQALSSPHANTSTSVPTSIPSPPAPAYYSPTFSHSHPHPYANLSNISSPHTSLTPAPGLPITQPPRVPVSLLPVESPPQTNSSVSHERRGQTQDGLEEYRLRSIVSPATVGVGVGGPGTTSIGSMPVTVSLPAMATSSSIASPPTKPSKRKGSSSRKDSKDIRTGTTSSAYTSTSFPFSFSKAKRSFGYNYGSHNQRRGAGGRKGTGTPTTAGSGIAWATPSVSGSSYEEYSSRAHGYGGYGRRRGGSSSMGDFDEDFDGDGDESVKMEFDFDQMGIPGEEEEDSPYPEVRASVSNIDDPEMPALTLRMWIIGLTLSILSCAANVFFTFRNPAPTIPPNVVLLLSYPVGKFFAYALPIRTYKFPSIPLPVWLPSWLGGVRSGKDGVNVGDVSGVGGIGNGAGRQRFLGGWEVSLNPGPWNIKEHVLIYIMSNVTNVPPYALNMIVVSDINYHVRRGFLFDLVLIFVTQLTGFGLAGLCRRFLVWPAAMVWPQNLVVCTLLNTLHAEDDFVPPPVGAQMGIAVGTNGSVPGHQSRSLSRSKILRWWDPRRWWIAFKWKYSALWGGTTMTRYQFFVFVGLASFFWFFLPGYLWTGLGFFSWVCWIAPKNVVVNQLFGVYSGLGMGVITFDWTQIAAWNGSPLAVPWWAQCHVFAGFVLFYWILMPILYYTNVWHFSYFPISSISPFDRDGKVYDVHRVLTPEVTLNLTAYKDYSPLYLPANYAMTYLIAFAMSTCILVHTALHHGRSLLNGIKKVKSDPDDIHAKLMRNYPEVPDWWYGAMFLFFFIMAVIMVEVWHTGIPVYILVLSLCLPIIYILPGGFILAMTGQPVGINILAQIIPGAIKPGSPLINMLFKTYAIQTLAEAEEFVQDLKLGHYIKVPPRATFIVQLAATTIAATVQIGVKTWLFASVGDICEPHQKSALVCPHNEVFFTASAIWGLIGPTRQFGKGTLYNPQLYALVIGAFLPIPFWLWHRKYPNSRLPLVNTPVFLNGITQIPPATGINFSSWFATGFIFQYLIRKKNFPWWTKYNYVTSAGLDCGTSIAIIIIFFCFAYPKGGIFINWWGNSVWQQTADYKSLPFRNTPPGGIPGT